MVHIIPLSIAQRRLDTGNAPQYPQGSPIGGAMQGFGDQLSAVAARHQQMKDQQEAFDAELVRRRFDSRVAQAEDEVAANAPADGAGMHETIYGQVDPRSGRVVKTGLFDTLFDDALPNVPGSQRAAFAMQKEPMRMVGARRMALRQRQRRHDYELAQVDTELKTSAIAIGNADPDDPVTFEAVRQKELDLIDKMGVDPGIRQQIAKDWFGTTAKARFEALIAKDPKRALEMFGVGTPTSGNAAAGVQPMEWIRVSGSSDAAAKNDGVGRLTPDERVAQAFHDEIPPEDRPALLQQARAADAARQAEMRTRIGLAELNAPAAIRDTGTYPGPTPTPEQFISLYGPTEGARRFRAFNQALDVSWQFYAMRGMSNEAVRAKIRDAAPKANSHSPEEDKAHHDAIITAADLTFRARHGDPGGYVRETFANLDAAWNNLSKPEDYQAAIIGSIAAQEQLGFDTVRPLPNSVAGGVIDGLKNGTKPQDHSLNSIFAALPTEAAQKAMLDHLTQTSGAQAERSLAERIRRDWIVDPKMLLDLPKAAELGLRDSNAELTNYIQSSQDKIGQFIVGDSKPNSMLRKLARMLVGSEGAGEQGISLLDATGLVAAEKTIASAIDGNYGDMIFNAAGVVPAERLASIGLQQAGKIAGPLVKELSPVLRRPDDLAEGAEALLRGSSGKLANSTDDVLSEGVDLYKNVDDLSNVGSELPSGSFSISDWTDYPAMIPKPEGPFRLVEGAEYDAARKAANRANRAIRRKLGLVGKPVDVHEIKPVGFGGSPTDMSNKVILPRDVHLQQVTPWWNRLMKDLGG